MYPGSIWVQILGTFVRTLIMHICRKTIYFIEGFFDGAYMSKIKEAIICDGCNEELRLTVMRSLHPEGDCPMCGTIMQLPKEIKWNSNKYGNNNNKSGTFD